ncbi:TlpA family protein disulfide reductase [Chromatocurvus halotolerans]|uniref:Thiol-disulfide isomerase/thioredoxin n=1 Tax=Chromatocurvus halotolerans TaxID=1132028 RepID=A0A4R2KXA6_9GAMM|nr:TlpA disulfide reductase family protein [Chromatocurvus halotolerans]TCO75949.1 thiol-disulfide isomerase/thioredoxin [Chromatocurvus halotolerans]
MTLRSNVRRPLAALWFLLMTMAGCDPSADGPLAPIRAAQGDWVVVNYWAEWCKPCIKEVPELNELNSRDDVTVLGVNFDGATGDALAQQLKKLGIDFATLPEDPAQALGTERPVVLPTTLVFHPDGQLIQTLVGPQTLDSLLEATVQRSAK